uniref:Ribosomal_L30 domain-containing protein n=1 Tax=Macrostomum lignano TaxID=282301 RepID=A0A1I8JPM7_9PLAT
SHQLTKFRLDTNNSHTETTDNGRHQETRGALLPTVQETMLKRRKAAWRPGRRGLDSRRRTGGWPGDSGGPRHQQVEPTGAQASSGRADGSCAANLIVRCRGRSAGIGPRIVKALRLFRLTRLNTAVFAKPTPACLSVLRLLDPFVAWGAPDMRSVRELVYKRGRASGSQSEAGNQQRPVPITDNAAIEAALGKIRPIVHLRIWCTNWPHCGPAFVQAASYLAPMRLKAPLGGWAKAEARFRGNESQPELIRKRQRLVAVETSTLTACLGR